MAVKTDFLAGVMLTGALLLSGCAAAPAMTPGGYVSPTEPVFLLTEAQADRVLIDAMNAEFGNSPMVKVQAPHQGYQATIRFMIDTHQIVALMVPSRGIGPDGMTVDGYYFSVTHQGTMPISGHARAGRLRQRLQDGASAIAVRVQPAGR